MTVFRCLIIATLCGQIAECKGNVAQDTFVYQGVQSGLVLSVGPQLSTITYRVKMPINSEPLSFSRLGRCARSDKAALCFDTGFPLVSFDTRDWPKEGGAKATSSDLFQMGSHNCFRSVITYNLGKSSSDWHTNVVDFCDGLGVTLISTFPSSKSGALEIRDEVQTDFSDTFTLSGSRGLFAECKIVQTPSLKTAEGIEC